MTKTVVYVVGRDFCQPDRSWQVQGVFSTRELAEAACHSPDYFVGPIQMNMDVARETIEWPGAYYPIGGGPKK